MSERHHGQPPRQCETRIVVKGLEWQCAMRHGHNVAEKTPDGTGMCTIFSRPDYRAEIETVRSPPPKKRRKPTRKQKTKAAAPPPPPPSVVDRVFAQLVAGTITPGRPADSSNIHPVPTRALAEERA